MISYTLEENKGSFNIFLVDESHNVRELIAVVFNKSHGKIILRGLNDYSISHPVGNKVVDIPADTALDES